MPKHYKNQAFGVVWAVGGAVPRGPEWAGRQAGSPPRTIEVLRVHGSRSIHMQRPLWKRRPPYTQASAVHTAAAPRHGGHRE